MRREIDNPVASLAAGVPADTIAPAIRARTAALAQLETALATPPPAKVNLDRLRTVLTDQAEAWTAELREEPKIARLLVRRLVGPMTLTDSQDFSGLVDWEATVTPDILDEMLRGSPLVHDGQKIGVPNASQLEPNCSVAPTNRRASSRRVTALRLSAVR